MAKLNTADIGFEDQIWKAADKMRGNLDASEYKSVVLGLIFLKYISDKFEARYQALVDEGEGFEEDKDEYTAENIFYVPTEARWSVIAAAAHTPEIGTTIDNAMRAIEKENRRLKDILPKNFARHSWATAARNHNVPISVISQGMGHTSEQTTQIYLTMLENSVIDDANKGIISSLAELC